MTATLTLRQWPTPIRLPAGATVLDAALAAGVPFPHGCRRGRCSACKADLVAGRVEHQPHDPHSLTAAERAEGVILSCRAVPDGDVTIAWRAHAVPDHPLRYLRCRVARLEAPAPDVRIVRLTIERGGPFAFSPGQYAALSTAGLAPRDFSMASLPDDEALEFHIRRGATGSLAAHVADLLREGDSMRVEGPYGGMVWQDWHTGPIIAVAGGTGLAPVLAVARVARDRHPRQRIHLYHAARDAAGLYALDRLRQWAARPDGPHLVPLAEAGPLPAGVRRGRAEGALHEDWSGGDGIGLDGAKAYIAGPPPMVEVAARTLRRLGLPGADIHTDPFIAAADRAAALRQRP